MTTISHAAIAPANLRAAPTAKTRNFSLDRTRTFLTLVVLLHHAVIPYTYFGNTDPKFWIGFDMIVLTTDSFFMAMFFFLSGLLAWPGLTRKGPPNYLGDRLLRLGLPYVICALTIMPTAYYAIALRQTPDLSFAAFWWKTVTAGPWPSGPIWFLWVLLAFDLIASVLYLLSPRLIDPINRLSLRAYERPAVIGFEHHSWDVDYVACSDPGSTQSTRVAPGIFRKTAVAAQLKATVSAKAMIALAVADASKSNSQYCIHSTIG